MVRDILIWPHPTLKKKAAPVSHVNDAVRALVKDMFETMYAADGVGLAAPQIGVLQRVIVLDTREGEDGAQPIAMINPEIVAAEGETTFTEGCLSIPGEAAEVDRAEVVTVRFLDADGVERSLVADELLAIAVQHEIDHLDGIVYVDHIPSEEREVIRRRMKKLQQNGERRPEA